MKNRLVASFLVIGIALYGLSFVSKNKTNCVTVYVNFGQLDPETEEEHCIDVSGKVNALELLRVAGYKVEGTQKYGDAVVCRLNNLPDRSIESCEVMPPEDAFWAVIVKENQFIPLFNDWGWAQVGVNELYLSSGDSLGLVYSKDGDLQWP